MVKFTFRPFKSQEGSPSDQPATEQPQNSYQRRREQVRRAQKTHRERKESYVKSLETEVMQLRAIETRSYHEIKALQAQVKAMKTLLVENGIFIPSISPPPSLPPIYGQDDTQEASSENIFEFSISENPPKSQGERICVKTHAKEDNIKANASQHNISTTTLDMFNPPIETPFSHQDPTALGIDFILSLEGPCLRHIPATSENEEPSGHALLASATLLHQQQSCLTAGDHAANSTWTIPKLAVERLLELSTSIPLDGEVTPVQAWDYIRHHLQYHDLDCARLEKLKATLLLQVKCYGFGAVLPQHSFKNAVFTILGKGSFF